MTNTSTSISLLERIKSNDEDAWLEFSKRYILILENWCRAWQIQNFDAQDVIQDTLLAVLTGIKNFERRGTGSFRAWMKTIAWRSWRLAITKAERRQDLELLKCLQSSDAYQNLKNRSIASQSKNYSKLVWIAPELGWKIRPGKPSS